MPIKSAILGFLVLNIIIQWIAEALNIFIPAGIHSDYIKRLQLFITDKWKNEKNLLSFSRRGIKLDTTYIYELCILYIFLYIYILKMLHVYYLYIYV